MDAYEATRVVFSRIQALDPENAAKIMGLLLIQDHGEKEMIRLAFGPEALLHAVILKAKKDLGLLPQSPSAAAAGLMSPVNPPPFSRHQQNSASSRFGVAPPPLTIASPSWAPPPPAGEGIQCSSDELSSPPVHEFLDDFGSEHQQQQQHLSFFSDPYVVGSPHHHHHRRSFSAAPDLCIATSPVVDGAGFGWKPCLYFARGFCKNGTSCRFLHGLPPEDGSFGRLDATAAMEQELMLRSKGAQRLLQQQAFPYSPTPLSPSSSKCMNFLLQQQQQNESQRAAAAVAAAAMMLGGDESYKFMGRSRSDFAGIVNPGSRQIYLTFPADSTFREEDVSNYFSIYGPVQDVRIPYQQKRMFGFVTFVYPETVKLILAKGNPHFVCDARVLVKPYKEKGKVPDKKQQGDQRGDAQFFSACTPPTGLDSRDPFDFQQFGPRMMYNNSNSGQEMMLRRKLEEQQQQAAELQQAIELQGRRFMGLQLLDFKNRSVPSPTTISSPTTTVTTAPSNERSHEGSPTEDKSPSPASSGTGVQVKALVNAADKEESAPNEESDFQESVEHNLPDSPFASPTKLAASLVEDPFSGPATVEPEFGNAVSDNGNHLIGSTLLPPTSSLDMASFKSCFFQMPRFSSGHGAVGM